jgi:hypothetical protein
VHGAGIEDPEGVLQRLSGRRPVLIVVELVFEPSAEAGGRDLVNLDMSVGRHRGIGPAGRVVE